MEKKLFISYSRRQMPFVDRLADQLERSGYFIWLDYQCMVPAKPWYEQIRIGIAEADVFLLIISKDSIASKNVEPEWRRALEFRKRIVLLIFEAVPLPVELQNCEWVDFRLRYRQSLKQLQELIDRPAGSAISLAPQKGLKAPTRLWLAVFLSVIVLIGSIPIWWTLLVPLIVLPLPKQIYKQTYALSRIAALLLTLPMLLWTGIDTLPFLKEGSLLYGLQAFFDALFIPTTLASWTLLVILFTPTMQRRARPEAAAPRFAKPLPINLPSFRSIWFVIDYAPEDSASAEEFRRVLERHGHRLVSPGEQPEAIFVLLSTYKKDTAYDPDHQAVFPVLLQNVTDIDPKLRRIQWIEFGHGIRNIDLVAKFLPEPERLIKTLAMPPIGSREFFPLAVNALQYYFVIPSVMSVGALLTFLLSVGVLLFQGNAAVDHLFFVAFINVGLLFGIVSYALRGLRSRRGGTATLYPLLVLIIFHAVVNYVNWMSSVAAHLTDENPLELLNLIGFDPILAIVFILPLLIWIGMLLFLIRWRTLRYRWLPRLNGSFDRLESLLLLYTPADRRVLVFHALFHLLLFMVYALFVLAGYGFYDWAAFGYSLPVLFMLLWGIRFLARRVST